MLVAICRVLYFLYFYPKNLILQNAQIEKIKKFEKKSIVFHSSCYKLVLQVNLKRSQMDTSFFGT